MSLTEFNASFTLLIASSPLIGNPLFLTSQIHSSLL